MVSVVMTCYNPTPDAPRNGYAQRCVEAFERHLEANEIELVIADDGSPEPFDPLCRMGFWTSYAVVTGPHGGIGASLNRALDGLVGPWMYTTDDWLLTEKLDLEFPVWLLSQGYDLVRLGPIHPNLWCRTKFTAGHGWWLDVRVDGGGFVFATRPFLAAPSLLDKMGPFPEGLDAYETERVYSTLAPDSGIKVAAINLAGPWEHIGEFEVGDHDPAFPFGKGAA